MKVISLFGSPLWLITNPLKGIKMDIKQVKETYFTLCTQLNLPPRQVILSAGAALLLLEVRDGEAEDLDVDIPPEVYDRLACMQYPRHTFSAGEYLEYSDKVSLHRGKDIQPTMEIDNVFLYSGLTLLEQKICLLEMPDRKPEKIKRDILELDLLLGSLALQAMTSPAQKPSEEQCKRCMNLFGLYWGK